MKSFYDILGIHRTASSDEIKIAYRKLAREHHPDKGGNKEQFQKIQEAYETLINPDKRNNYDNPQSNPFPTQFSSNFSFTQTRRINKNDYVYNCNITLKDVFYGTNKKIKASRKIFCKNCINECNICHGVGRIIQKINLGIFTQVIEHSCQNCNGTGNESFQNNCNKCNNNRHIIEEKIFEINISKGIENGYTFIFEHWGEQASNKNEIPGNLIVKINIEQHPIFTRDGDDLLYNCDISFAESITGKILSIPNFDNTHEVNTLGFGVINPFKEYTLIGKGMMSKNGNRGNLKIHFKIKYPDNSISYENISRLNNIFKDIGW